MKTAIYIEDGTVQLVITPESEFEKNAVRSFSEKGVTTTIFEGAFYDCRGGWVRQKAHYYGSPRGAQEDISLIIKMEKEDKCSA